MLLAKDFLKQAFMVRLQFKLANTRHRFVIGITAYKLLTDIEKISQRSVGSDSEGLFYLGLCNVHG